MGCWSAILLQILSYLSSFHQYFDSILNIFIKLSGLLIMARTLLKPYATHGTLTEKNKASGGAKDTKNPLPILKQKNESQNKPTLYVWKEKKMMPPFASPYDQNSARIEMAVRNNRKKKKRERALFHEVIGTLICLQFAALFIWRWL